MEETVAIIIFAVVIAAIMTEKIHRVAAALGGTVLLLLMHILTLDQAVDYIDFDTVGVLVGMMLFVAVVKNSGLFEYVAIKGAKMAKGNPVKIMIAFMIITAILSAFLNNVTTVLLIGPMTITVARMLEINPIPLLIPQILATNIGGTSTLIGDPPNIMIGSAAGYNFMDFIINLGPAIVVITLALVITMRFLYKDKLHASDEAISKIMELDENKAIEDIVLLKKSLVMMVLVVIGFMLQNSLQLNSSTIALTAGVIMLIIGKQNVEDIVSEVEWSTILFFVGLFVVVGGLDATGVISAMAHMIINFTEGHQIITMLVLLWASAILSAFIDNIPFVATLIPLVSILGENGMDVAPLWWAISLGACLGGNGTLIGASANVVLSGISGKYGYPITFKDYLKVGFPVMIMTIVISTGYLLIRYA